MLDPGALGTLMIGLEAIRQKERAYSPAQPHSPRPPRRGRVRIERRPHFGTWWQRVFSPLRWQRRVPDLTCGPATRQ
jgi:hypothetical protein